MSRDNREEFFRKRSYLLSRFDQKRAGEYLFSNDNGFFEVKALSFLADKMIGNS